MTGDLIKAMRACPQPIIAAVDGICAGAGAIIAMASDMRLAATGAKVAFLFNKVGLSGCDMGACAILPRIIGQSRASELLYTGRFMTAEEGERWGFFSRIVAPDHVLAQAQLLAKQVSEGPTFANTMTKRMLAMEWAMSVEEAIEAEAVAQALCMTTEDFARAFEAFSRKLTPAFQGNGISSWPGIAVRRTASLPLAYVPAIHVLAASKKGVDARVKPGHDELCHPGYQAVNRSCPEITLRLKQYPDAPITSLGAAHEDRDHRRRTGWSLCCDPVEEAAAAGRDHGLRAQPRRRHFWLRRGVLGRDAG
jgi:hypothetical protein